ncbi:Endonuclease/Exonuclease/phosphatase family [Spironucleus salmonicida]|uniref:Endonuclease/Exonuclease/phosphatase family n=1 Tax=Spironucleus salmonicida TaxID=348837 RepID=V6LBW4_9EUKA|nr:Endonuclease/Exonuclease/phosphatase family [Spironucleus salmonicida]|eukprot:EST41698.1 hypothetical protein SS50377_18785 [Spironucleus salmonicida]
MRVATLNVHFWSKANKLNYEPLINELKNQLSNMDVVCLQEVTFGQKINQPLVPYDKSPKKRVIFNKNCYKIIIDESSPGRLENSIREQLGFPLSFTFKVENQNDTYTINPSTNLEECWHNQFQTLDSTVLRLLQNTFSLPFCIFAGTQNPNFGNAILSRHQFSSLRIIQLFGKQNQPWSQRSAISAILDTPVPIQIITTHLDHLKEEERIVQCQQLMDILTVSNVMPQLLMGDFNSLTQQDYTSDQLLHINNKRKKNNIELAKFDLINLLQQKSWLDCAWNGPKPVFEGTAATTSRFDTRIDYIFTNRVFVNCIASYRIFTMQETDHNGVFAVFYPVYRSLNDQ